MGAPSKNPTVWCGVCGRGGKNEPALAQHVWAYHKGTPKSVWLRSEPPIPTVALATASPIPDGSIVQVGGRDLVKTRSLPPKSDRHNAEKLVDLPWIKFPSTADECEEALNHIAVAIERSQATGPFFCSLRAYIDALRKRLKYAETPISGRCVA